MKSINSHYFDVVRKSLSRVTALHRSLGKKAANIIDKLLFSSSDVHEQLERQLCKKTQKPRFFDPAMVNASTDLVALAKGLEVNKAGLICLYGPSGTGKTAFARWLADELKVPLLEKRISDLITPFIGDTEKNIAQAFREAECDNALLLIDEVDSFLQDRRGAQRTWEVTAVNEMLVQMETYSGLFIASTNFMENLDQAVLRRFDLKVKFDFLKPNQAWSMFLHQTDSLGIPCPLEDMQSELRRLTVLTPGDFALVARRHRFIPITDAQKFIGVLAQECAYKEVGKRGPMGFHHRAYD